MTVADESSTQRAAAYIFIQTCIRDLSAFVSGGVGCFSENRSHRQRLRSIKTKYYVLYLNVYTCRALPVVDIF